MADWEQLLAPIDPDHPAGTDLRLVAGDLTFANLDELRREADPLLDPGGETKRADWRGVANLCEGVLREQSKDLQIASVYAQALTHQEGFAGMAAGLRLLAALTDTFWETITPGYDEGEIIEAIRARPLSWVGTSRDFLAAVKRVALTAPVGQTPLSWLDYEQAQRLDSASMKSDRTEYQELVEAGLISTEDWYASLGATPPERVQAALDGLRDCQAALGELSALCDRRFTESGPYFTDLVGLLDEMQELLMSNADEAAVAAGAAADAANPETGAPAATVAGAGGGGPAGPIANRDEAYRRLREVADFLRKTEPHSPVPSLLDRAARWGNMTFENLFDDVVKNPDVRNQTKDLLGLPKSQD